MSNSFYNNTRSFTPGTSANGNAVDDKFDAVGAGFDAVETKTTQAVKLTNADIAASQEITADAATRANKVLGFNEAGDLTLKVAGATYRGNWATATFYRINDIVKDAAGAVGLNNVYICTTEHTSANLATDIGNWALMIDVESVEAAKLAAQAAQTGAEAAESGAITAQIGAVNAQSYSEEWANKAEDSLISVAAGGNGTTEYSSLHWAAKAAASAAAAAASEAATASALTTHAALTATHGVSGAIVGTSDTQTLTNKTFDQVLGISGTATQQRYIEGRTNGSIRWRYGVTGDAESTGNAGSNFYITTYDDAGVFIARALTITRADSKAYFNSFGAATFSGGHQVEIYHAGGAEGLLVRSGDADSGSIMISGRRTGNGSEAAFLELANRDSSSTAHTAVARIVAERQGVDSLDLAFKYAVSGATTEVLRFKATGDLQSPSKNTYLGYYAGSNIALAKIGYGRDGDNDSYLDLVSSVTRRFTYDARLIRNSGDNGRLDLINQGTGGIRFWNTSDAQITFVQNGLVSGYFDTDRKLRLNYDFLTDGLVTAKGYVNAGLGTAAAAYVTIGNSRTADADSGVAFYTNSLASTTLTASLVRASGPNNHLTLLNAGTGSMIFSTNSTERMRLDSSGVLLIGTTDTSPYDNTSGEGVAMDLRSLQVATDAAPSISLNRMTDYGAQVVFYQAGVWHGAINVEADGPEVLKKNGGLAFGTLINAAPSTTTSPGKNGQMFVNSTHLYVCIGTNTWRRVALSTW